MAETRRAELPNFTGGEAAAITKPIVGETVLTSRKVIELAAEAANGAVAHVGLAVDAPIPAVRAFRSGWTLVRCCVRSSECCLMRRTGVDCFGKHRSAG